jgi:hypothetical protein
MKRSTLLTFAAFAIAAACSDATLRSPTEPTGGPVPGAYLSVSGTEGAIIATDKDDYAPGEVVTITGTGWAAGETVHLKLEENPVTDSATHEWDVVADGNGTFTDTSFTPGIQHLYVTFTLTATGPISGVSTQLTFTDGPLNRLRFVNPTSSQANPVILTTLTTPVNACTALTVASFQGNNETNQTTAETLTLGTDVGAFYTTSSCTTTTASGSIGIGSSRATVFFKHTANAVASVTASSSTVSGSNAASIAITVGSGRQNQTITFNALPNKTYGDAPFTVSATASSGLTVSFAASGNCTVSGSTVTITVVGNCTITASQGVSASFNAAPNVSRTFAIERKPLTATVAVANKPYDGTTAASITGHTFTGVVGTDNVNVVGGTATFDDKNVGTGKTVTITGLNLGGNDKDQYVIATPVTAKANITPVGLTVTAVATPAETTYPNSPTFTATYNGFVNNETETTAGALTGTLAFDVLDASNNVVTTTPLPQNAPNTSYKLRAKGLTSNNYLITFVDATFTVIRRLTTVTNVAATTSVYGSTTDLSAVVGPADVPGSMQFFVNGSTTAAAGTVSYDPTTGQASLTGYAHGLDASPTKYSVRAVFTPSSASYQGSEATNAAALTVNKLATSLVVTAATITYGEDAVVSAVLTDGSTANNPLVGKTVSFTVDGVTKTGTTNATGKATATFTGLEASTAGYALTVEFAPETNYIGSSDATQKVIVNPAPTTVANVAATESVYQGTTDLSADVTPVGVAGSVEFFINGSATAIPATYVASTGKATVTGHTHGLDARATGYSVRAVFTPTSSNYTGDDETNSTALIVDPIPTSVTNVAATNSIYGGTTNLSADVTPAGVAGSVAFFVNGSSTPVAATYNSATGKATVTGYPHGPT